jgi:pectate lyase C
MRFRSSVVLGVLAGTFALSAHAGNRPPGYKTICTENKTCTVAGPIWVAFGRADKFFSKQMSGTFVCNQVTFGGRINGGTNECSVPIDGVSPPPAPPPAPPPPPPPPAPPEGGQITGSTCVSTGEVTVSQTIVVSSGTYDGGCRTYNPTLALGDGGQGEGQLPVFRVENGATLRNVIIGLNGADGIHFYRGGHINNVRWLNVGEDAFTVKEGTVSQPVTITGITGVNAQDKFGQINAPTTLTIRNCVIDDVGKVIRQNGGTNFTAHVNVELCQLTNVRDVAFRSDSSTSTVSLRNSRISRTESLCEGSWASCTATSVVEF